VAIFLICNVCIQFFQTFQYHDIYKTNKRRFYGLFQRHLKNIPILTKLVGQLCGPI